jgi:hypothetical protein
MTIFKVNTEDLSNFTVETEPKVKIVKDSKITLFGRRNFVSNPLKSIRKSGEKDIPSNDYLKPIIDLSLLNKTNLDIPPLELTPKRLSGNTTLTSTEVAGRYPEPQSNIQKLLPRYDEILQKKWMIQDLLNPFYGFSDDWSYEDFHCLNFFRPNDFSLSVVDNPTIGLVYPNIDGRYDLNDNASISFWIRPTLDFSTRIGTVIHVPNCLAIFLFKGEDGKFGLKIQALEDANNHVFNEGSQKSFVFSDCIDFNRWNFIKLELKITSSTLSIRLFKGESLKEEKSVSEVTSLKVKDYSAILVGSFYRITSNFSEENSFLEHLFNNFSSKTKGIECFFENDYTEPENDNDYNFSTSFNSQQPGMLVNQLEAQVFNILISKEEGGINKKIFNLRPSFQSKSGFRNTNYLKVSIIDPQPVKAKQSGVPRTPFNTTDLSLYPTIKGTTTGPINPLISFGCGGHLINIENFLSDLCNESKGGDGFVRPRIFGFLFNEKVNIENYDTVYIDCEKFSFTDKTFFKRNLFILPCDNGDFVKPPNDFSKIYLTELEKISIDDKDDFLKSKDDLIKKFGSIPLIGNFWRYGTIIEVYVRSENSDSLPRTSLVSVSKDPSSNQYVLFEIPNLFFGKRIKPGTFSIKATIDTEKKFYFTLQDDGQGGLYPLNPNGNSAKWNIVGRVYYNEGLVLIKNPHLYFFGYNGDWEMSFKGEQNVHTLKIESIAQQNSLNESKNTTYVTIEWPDGLSPAQSLTDDTEKFAYITNINFHDKDLNIVAKTQLAQPFIKKVEDKVLFRIQLDF